MLTDVRSATLNVVAAFDATGLSQGLICKRLFKYVGNDTTVVMLGSIAALCVGRIAAIQATELTQVYVAFGPVAIALGVVNTGITNAGQY